jgi:hypothetical protein
LTQLDLDCNLKNILPLNPKKILYYKIKHTPKSNRSIKINLDSYVALLDKEGKPLDFIYFGNTISYDSSIKHLGNPKSNKSLRSEIIRLDLSKLDPSVKSLVIGIFVFSGSLTFEEIDYLEVDITDNKTQSTFHIKDFGPYPTTCLEIGSITRSPYTSQPNSLNYRNSPKGSDLSYGEVKQKYTREKPKDSLLHKIIKLIKSII